MDGVNVGTVTEDIANIVRTSKSSFDFKADKHGVLHTGIGKVSFDGADLEGNQRVMMMKEDKDWILT